MLSESIGNGLASGDSPGAPGGQYCGDLNPRLQVTRP
jgi:hypothetical protein